MKTYNLNNTRTLNSKQMLLRLIDDKYIDALEKALEYDDARRVNNIVDNFSMEIYKATGVWYNTFDYYYEYNDNLNGYVSLMIKRLNDVFK